MNRSREKHAAFVQSAIFCSEWEVQFSLGHQVPSPLPLPNSPTEKGITGNWLHTKKIKDSSPTDKAFIFQFKRQNACEQLQRQPWKDGKISHYYRGREKSRLIKKKKKKVNTSEDCKWKFIYRICLKQSLLLLDVL